mgnify:CR=1 FL=1
MRHILTRKEKIRVVEKTGAEAIRLEKRSEAFFILTVPVGAPQDAAEQFLQGREIAKTLPDAVLSGPVPSLPRRVLRAYCLETLKTYANGRLLDMEARAGCEGTTLTFDCPRGAWGRCHAGTKTVSINPSLCWMPESVVDECLLHELCHFSVPDHSPAFWERLTALMPSWPCQEGILRNRREGVRYVFPV